MRRLPTRGNLEFFSQLVETFVGKITHDCPQEIRHSVYETAQKIQSVRSQFSNIERLGRVEETPEKKVLPEDNSIHAAVERNWQALALEEWVDSFGRYGIDAVSGMGEAVLYSLAFAKEFQSEKIYFRGEAKYGHRLTSRAERNMPPGSATERGLTDMEIAELRRFQAEVKTDEAMKDSILSSGEVPQEDSPLWLPIMQHYDEKFGTRLLDISSSVYTGLYFACVEWNGTVNTDMDGLIYVFLRGNGGLHVRGDYFDTQVAHYDAEFDDIAPTSVLNSFKDWKYPEYLRVYFSSMRSERELAQDGLFLVRGAFKDNHQFGQGFKFRLPAEVKLKTARELWLAGYTPKRMVRGPKGIDAHNELAGILGVSP